MHVSAHFGQTIYTASFLKERNTLVILMNILIAWIGQDLMFTKRVHFCSVYFRLWFKDLNPNHFTVYNLMDIGHFDIIYLKTLPLKTFLWLIRITPSLSSNPNSCQKMFLSSCLLKSHVCQIRSENHMLHHPRTQEDVSYCNLLQTSFIFFKGHSVRNHWLILLLERNCKKDTNLNGDHEWSNN